MTCALAAETERHRAVKRQGETTRRKRVTKMGYASCENDVLTVICSGSCFFFQLKKWDTPEIRENEWTLQTVTRAHKHTNNKTVLLGRWSSHKRNTRKKSKYSNVKKLHKKSYINMYEMDGICGFPCKTKQFYSYRKEWRNRDRGIIVLTHTDTVSEKKNE